MKYRNIHTKRNKDYKKHHIGSGQALAPTCDKSRVFSELCGFRTVAEAPGPQCRPRRGPARVHSAPKPALHLSAPRDAPWTHRCEAGLGPRLSKDLDPSSEEREACLLTAPQALSPAGGPLKMPGKSDVRGLERAKQSEVVPAFAVPSNSSNAQLGLRVAGNASL